MTLALSSPFIKQHVPCSRTLYACCSYLKYTLPLYLSVSQTPTYSSRLRNYYLLVQSSLTLVAFSKTEMVSSKSGHSSPLCTHFCHVIIYTSEQSGHGCLFFKNSDPLQGKICLIHCGIWNFLKYCISVNFPSFK